MPVHGVLYAQRSGLIQGDQRLTCGIRITVARWNLPPSTIRSLLFEQPLRNRLDLLLRSIRGLQAEQLHTLILGATWGRCKQPLLRSRYHF